MSKDASEFKRPPKSPEREAASQVPPVGLTAKEIVKTVLPWPGPVTDDEILEKVRAGLSPDDGLRVNSATANACLTTRAARQWVDCSWSSFQLLDENDRQFAALEMMAKLNRVIVRLWGSTKRSKREVYRKSVYQQ